MFIKTKNKNRQRLAKIVAVDGFVGVVYWVSICEKYFF
jgi:hypothetical protein